LNGPELLKSGDYRPSAAISAFVPMIVRSVWTAIFAPV
jgi:hypothetical protein